MRRTRWGSPARPAARLVRPVVPSVLSLALLLGTPGLAEADPAADNLAALIANVAKANQRLQNLNAEIQTEQESVNKPPPNTIWRAAGKRSQMPTRQSPGRSSASTSSPRPPI